MRRLGEDMASGNRGPPFCKRGYRKKCIGFLDGLVQISGCADSGMAGRLTVFIWAV